MFYLVVLCGFCVGVDCVIKIVEMVLQKWGVLVYVCYEIVYNKFVVDSLCDKGVVFVEELYECFDDCLVIFLVYGVFKVVFVEVWWCEMVFVDVICLFVSKVYVEVECYYVVGLQMVMIGYEGYFEVLGIMGQLFEGEVFLVEIVDDVVYIMLCDLGRLVFIIQIMLLVDDIVVIVVVLQVCFFVIVGFVKEDICYVIMNCQVLVKVIVDCIDVLFVIGVLNSFNLCCLVEVGCVVGCVYL